MKLMELNDEQRFRVRHTIREYGYEAVDALIGLAKERDLEMPEMLDMFSAEIYGEIRHFRANEKAPEMLETSTEAEEIISEDNSSTTNPENPDPAKLIAEAAAKRSDTKLTAEQVAEIRRLRTEGKSAAWLANKFGVSLVTIYNKLSAAPKKEKEAWINKNTTPTAEYISGV